jgi:hypothetical protein
MFQRPLSRLDNNDTTVALNNHDDPLRKLLAKLRQQMDELREIYCKLFSFRKCQITCTCRFAKFVCQKRLATSLLASIAYLNTMLTTQRLQSNIQAFSALTTS